MIDRNWPQLYNHSYIQKNLIHRSGVMEFGILNQSPVLEGGDVSSSLNDTIELAQKADERGYRRYYVSEHHNEPLAGTAPEIMISHLLAYTKRINIGSGGVMLQHYNPFKIAEQFHLMSHLAPGRVDLGIGKAPGGLRLSTAALQSELAENGPSFDEKFRALTGFVNQTQTGEFKDLKTSPDSSNPPEIFLLGSSPGSAHFAARENVNFIYAHFISNDQKKLEDSISAYRKNNDKGSFIAALSVVVTDDKETQKQLEKENVMYELQHDSGKILRVKGEARALSAIAASEEPVTAKRIEADIIVGTREEVLQKLEWYIENDGIDELMFHLPTNNKKLRHQTIEALAPVDILQKV